MYERDWQPSTCPLGIDAPKPAGTPTNEREHGFGPQLSGPDPHAASILECAGLRAPAAVRHGNGSGNLSPGHRSALARPRTLEGGLCSTEPSADGWTLWREPEPPGPLLSVSGGPEAQPAGPAAAVSR